MAENLDILLKVDMDTFYISKDNILSFLKEIYLYQKI